MIGGMTWASTADYYRLLNEEVRKRLGKLNSAKILLYSFNFEEFKPPSDPAGWKKSGEILSGIAQKLEDAGADCIMICSNTPHMVADTVQQNISVPFIHIAEETAKEIARQNINTAGLLGTKFTMEQSFFRDRLEKFGIETLIPEEAERNFIHYTIFNELGIGIFSHETKEKYLEIIEDLKNKGAEGIIFGCTEIPMLIKEEESPLPVFDTLRIHAKAAVDFALEKYIVNI